MSSKSIQTKLVVLKKKWKKTKSSKQDIKAVSLSPAQWRNLPYLPATGCLALTRSTGSKTKKKNEKKERTQIFSLLHVIPSSSAPLREAFWCLAPWWALCRKTKTRLEQKNFFFCFSLFFRWASPSPLFHQTWNRRCSPAISNQSPFLFFTFLPFHFSAHFGISSG
jgi:hypothetical protein